MKITTKAQMYGLLASGRLGNTVKQYFNVCDWLREVNPDPLDLWGIRSLKPGDTRSYLNVPTDEVRERVYSNFRLCERYNISPMVDAHTVLRAQIQDVPGLGLHLEYVDPAVDLTKSKHAWREGFAHHRKEATGSAANAILEWVMTFTDYDMIHQLREQYPEHVIEFTVCNRVMGIYPFHRTVVWEVRAY